MKCEKCGAENFTVTTTFPDGSSRVRCDTCGNRWAGSRTGRKISARTGARSLGRKGAFPADITLEPDEALARFQNLKDKYDGENLGPSTEELEWRARYRASFAREALPGVSADDVKEFANSPHVANAGQMTMFNKQWAALGDDAAATKARAVIGHVLHGEGRVQDRLTAVIEDRGFEGFKGFREALATKVLACAEPETYVPIVTSRGPAGKVAFAQHVFGARIDPAEGDIGDVIVATNASLVESLRPHFGDLLEGAHFLWWAKAQP